MSDSASFGDQRLLVQSSQSSVITDHNLRRPHLGFRLWALAHGEARGADRSESSESGLPSVNCQQSQDSKVKTPESRLPTSGRVLGLTILIQSVKQRLNSKASHSHTHIISYHHHSEFRVQTQPQRDHDISIPQLSRSSTLSPPGQFYPHRSTRLRYLEKATIPRRL